MMKMKMNEYDYEPIKLMKNLNKKITEIFFHLNN